jgi:hypothetical protein
MAQNQLNEALITRASAYGVKTGCLSVKRIHVLPGLNFTSLPSASRQLVTSLSRFRFQSIG